MSNIITVTLDGRRYRLVAEESPEYMQEVAAYVNQQMKSMRGGNSFRSGVDCATLTALNLADTLFKERAIEEDLRRQLKEALDDVRKAEQRLREQKRTQRATATRKPKEDGATRPTRQLSLDESN